jgi:hypothetical protein
MGYINALPFFFLTSSGGSIPIVDLLYLYLLSPPSLTQFWVFLKVAARATITIRPISCICQHACHVIYGFLAYLPPSRDDCPLP